MIHESLPLHIAVLPALALAGIIIVPNRARTWIREWFTPHAWIGEQTQVCIAHDRCRGKWRRFNARGVRLCTATLPRPDAPAAYICELHLNHRAAHYDIDADVLWPADPRDGYGPVTAWSEQ